VAVIGAFGFGLWAIFKRRSLIGFGVVFAVVMSLPFLQLVPFRTWSLVSERFLFLPLLGLSIAVAVALAKVDPPKLRAGIAGAMFFLLLGGTFARALDWRSAETLLTENIRYSPHHHLAAEIYIDHVLDTRRYEDARRVARQVRYDRAREALKTYVDTREAKDSGDLSRARRSLDGLARGITWDSSILRLKIANLALEAGAPEVSAKVYAAVLEDRPYMPAVRYNLGLAYKQLGRKAEAVDQIELAISGGFRDGRVWNNLGLLLRDLGRTEQAEAAFLSGIAEDGRHWHAAYNLARLYIQQDRLTEGRQMLVEALARAESVGDDPSPVRALLEELDASSAPNR
jgi:tetratricopeptide (TPR) repeat protein